MNRIGTDAGRYFGGPKGVRVVGLNKLAPTSFVGEARKTMKKKGKRWLATLEGQKLLACLAVLGG